MTLPILNKAMWACFDSKGHIIWQTIDWTKEDSEKKGREGGYSECRFIAVDIEVIESQISA